ncbi:CDP-alcohol phosphatidyltransferase family protein [Candidatus Woesearchaeota archaeon]|nr:CDP-alcohol phosphatidyltransferase family protein [Candidatus Woesearchaeota archaeon]
MIRKLEEIKKRYDKNKKERAADGRITNAYRYVSTPIVYLLSKTPATGDHLTLMGVIFSIVASLSIATGNYVYSILGAVGLHLSFICDLCDGALNRAKKIINPKGMFVEELAHDVFSFSVMMGLGLNAYHHFSDIRVIYLTLATLFFIFMVISVGGKKAMFGKHSGKRPVNITDTIPKRGLSRLALEFMRLFNDMHKMIFILLFAAIFDVIHYAIFFYCPFYFAIVAVKLYKEYNSEF